MHGRAGGWEGCDRGAVDAAAQHGGMGGDRRAHQHAEGPDVTLISEDPRVIVLLLRVCLRGGEPHGWPGDPDRAWYWITRCLVYQAVITMGTEKSMAHVVRWAASG